MSTVDSVPSDHSRAEKATVAQHKTAQKPNFDIHALMKDLPALNDTAARTLSPQMQQRADKVQPEYDDESPFSYKSARIVASDYEEDYKRAKIGDKDEQKFIKDQLQQWHDLPNNAPMKEYANRIIDQLAADDPAAGALFRKGIVDGGGSISFE